MNMFERILKYHFNVLIPLLIFGVIVIIAQTGLFKSLSNNIYDFFIYLNRDNTTQNQIIIVEIDKKSIDKLGKWPWDRKIHYNFLKKISSYKPSLVAFYLRFSAFSDNESDKLFLDSIKNSSTVIIDTLQGAENQYSAKHLRQLLQLGLLGHDILPIADDNIVRSQFLWLNYHPSFSLSVLNMLNNRAYGYEFLTKKNDTNINAKFKDKVFELIQGTILIPINYKRSQQKFQRVSYMDVLDGLVPENLLKNKLVLVGFGVKGLYDTSMTPFSKHERSGYIDTVSPTMVQAQILDSLMNFSLLTAFNPQIYYMLFFLIIVLAFNLVRNQNILKQLVILLFVLPSITLLCSFIIFKYFSLWFPPLEFISSFILVFIALSTISALTTSRFLDRVIGDLSVDMKDKSNLHSVSTVDDKLINLVELVNIIHKDKDVLDMVLTSTNSVIMLLDDTGNIIYSNKPEYQRAGFNIKDLFKDLNFDEIKAILKEKGTVKKHLILKDNHYELLVNSAKEDLLVGVLNDITDMIKMNEMKTNIMRILTHELKTPLTSIMLCTETIRLSDDKGFKEKYLDQIVTCTEFIEKLIHDFLSLNKLEIVDFKIDSEQIEMVGFLKDMIEDMLVIAESKNIKLELASKVEKIEFAGDKKYLFIAIKNLIDNAIKYSTENTTVQIGIELNEKVIILKIKDQGMGIHEIDQAKLFEKFYRVKSDKTKGISGSGLGLSFVKRIIELHNSRITLYSKLNEGSEFTIEMPVCNTITTTSQ